MFSGLKGLTASEVESRLGQYGPNILPEKPPPTPLMIFVQQLKSPFVYVLLTAALVTLLIGHYTDAVVISVAVLINAVLGFVQENKANNALQSLKKYITAKVTVIRDSKRQIVDALGLVPGDLVILDQGAKVPADGKLIFANRFYADEAVLTGESIPVNKTEGDVVYMGSIVSAGRAVLHVEKTGEATKMGSIALQVQEAEGDTPLQKQLKKFSNQLVYLILSLTACVFLLGVYKNLSLIEIFTTSVALAVSSLPEGLIISLTVVLAVGMQRIVRLKGLVRKLSAAETLGGVTVICVDKTGTLTQGKMEVVDSIGKKEDLAKQSIIANDLDDPIVVSAFEWGKTIIKEDLIPKFPRLDSLPFSPKSRFFASLNKTSGDTNTIFVNGAAEHLLDWCNLHGYQKEEILSDINTLTNQGKRLIGLAKKDVSAKVTKISEQDIKHGLNWVGILAFTDPVRNGVKEALNEADRAGIKVTVITGDYPKTAEFVLLELGRKVLPEEVLTGEELAKLNADELSKKIKTVKLFARTTPDQKLTIVEALKKNGEVVAMMGDGVNDAPALHKADIGIVVSDASDVSKESSDLVLLDSNFSTIVHAIEEGRGMFENLRKIILYLMSDAFAEILVVVAGIVTGLPLPLTAFQILWINIVSDGFPSMALTIDPKRANIMSEPPRNPEEKLVTSWMISLIGIVSFVAGMAAFIIFYFVLKTSGDATLARSVTFLSLGLVTLTYVFSVRELTMPFWKNNVFQNKWLVVAVCAGFVLQILPFIFSTTRQYFDLRIIEPVYWLMAISLSLLLFFVIEIFKLFYGTAVLKSQKSYVTKLPG